MLAKRKAIRLKNYDYNASGYYFVTVCTRNKEKLLGDVVGTVLPDGPQCNLSIYGKIVAEQLETMRTHYDDIRIEHYVVMPNHVHLLIWQSGNDQLNGPSRNLCPLGTTVPTKFPNISKLSRFIGTFKRFCNRQCNINLWQTRFHDHIIRNEADYLRIWEYIDTNPQKWQIDCFFTE